MRNPGKMEHRKQALREGVGRVQGHKAGHLGRASQASCGILVLGSKAKTLKG